MSDPVDQVYSEYVTNPNPDNLSKVIKSLEPTIGYTLGSMNAGDDPLAKSKAYIYTAQAIKKFKPETAGAASLPTYVSSQLQQMRRTMRDLRSPVKIPDRAKLDNYKLSEARKAFEDQFGREPDHGELADFTGIPMKRLEKIQRYQVATPTEAAMGDTETSGPDLDRDALDYVYHDADHTDRRILEHRTGYGGAPILDPKSLALKLKLTPVQLTRRSMRLTKQINDLKSSLEAVV